MHLRHAFGNLRQRFISSVQRREYALPEDGPLISFTFDDFPLSALQIGGAILKSYEMCGTYYAAMGLMDRASSQMGPYFGCGELKSLLRDGHELGSHTFDHVSCRTTSVCDFVAEVTKGKEAAERVSGAGPCEHFSYPYGHVTLRIKQTIGGHLASCRGIFPGINISPVDVNLLHANSLYSGSFDLHSFDRLVQENSRRRGWLIFYTHDISERPSPFGCTPAQFESVVKLVKRSRALVIPIGQVAKDAV